MFLYIFMLNYAVIKLAKNTNTAVIYMLACGRCSYDRFIFCSGFSHSFCAASVMLLWTVSRCGLICQDRDASLMGCQLAWPPSPLLTLFSSLFPCHTVLFLQVHPTIFPSSPPCLSLCFLLACPPLPLSVLCLLLLYSQFSFNFFMSSASPCLSPCSPLSLSSLPSYQIKWGLPTREHDKQAPFHWIPGVTVPSSLYQHGTKAFLLLFSIGQLEETPLGIYTGNSYGEQSHEQLISGLPPVNCRELWI